MAKVEVNDQFWNLVDLVLFCWMAMTIRQFSQTLNYELPISDRCKSGLGSIQNWGFRRLKTRIDVSLNKRGKVFRVRVSSNLSFDWPLLFHRICFQGKFWVQCSLGPLSSKYILSYTYFEPSSWKNRVKKIFQTVLMDFSIDWKIWIIMMLKGLNQKRKAFNTNFHTRFSVVCFRNNCDIFLTIILCIKKYIKNWKRSSRQSQLKRYWIQKIPNQ